MPKGKKKTVLDESSEVENDISEEIKAQEEGTGPLNELSKEVTKELKSTFSLPKFGLKNRTQNVMARIDEQTSKILDALVAFELAPSRSSAAAFLIAAAIRKDKEKYLKILESFETIKKAKKEAQYSFYKSLQDIETDKRKDDE